MTLPDWNNNGERDAFDAFVDMQIVDEMSKIDAKNKNKSDDEEKREITGISMGGKILYDATKDSDGMVILKSFSAIAILIASLAIPVKASMEGLGVCLCMFTGIGIALAILKNT